MTTAPDHEQVDVAPQSAATPTGALEGIRIIDWTMWQQGPVAGALLGDLGAEVIKVEERVGGDSGRAMLSYPDTGYSPYFEVNNRNKRSLTVDLKKPEGVALIHELASRSDVFVQNFRPGIAERVGLDYESMRRVNPQLVYACASAFGPNGPERSARAYDLLGQGRSGLLMPPWSDEPGCPDGGLADQMGAIMLAWGILAALVARERHGIGQRVDTSLLGSMLCLRGLPLALELMRMDGERAASPWGNGMASVQKPSRRDPGNPLWNTYRCGDGRWLGMAMVQSDPHWETLLDALDRPPALTDDSRFADHVSRCANAAVCVAILDEVFACRTRDEWLERLTATGDLPVAPMNTTAEAATDVMAIANDYVTSFEHPVMGPVRAPGFPVGLSETPARIHRRAPEFGEHTEEILIDILGKDWDEVARLRAAEVI